MTITKRMVGSKEDFVRRMKQTRFGCEVEMTGILRSTAAEIAAVTFETNRFSCTASRNGYDTWSAWDGENREWKFSRDSSIEGESDKKCELITPVLDYNKDIELLASLLRKLRHAGAKSNGTLKCGVHVHISGEGHTVQSLINLVNLMAAHEEQLITAVGISDRRLFRYCKTVDRQFLDRLHKNKPKTMEAFRDCWYNGQSPNERYSSTRYHMLNLHSFFNGHHTIEFRLFQFDDPSQDRRGGLHAGQLRAMILLCLALNQQAKERKYILAKPQQTENEAFALRTFLVRIGFVGEEFKAPRKYFLRNAKGNSAWRFR